jgi:hypothetical protein
VFSGAIMGMDLQAWRMSSMARALATCTPDTPRAALRTCRVADRPISHGFQARDLTYVFVDDRLARIAFRTSIDGFADTMAFLKTNFGQPAVIKRDETTVDGGISRPHVEIDWRNGRSTIRLSDPVRNAVDLSVQFTLDSEAARAGASAL